MHGSAAGETSAVADGYCQALRGVGEALVAAQPEGPTRPVEDHAGYFSVGAERGEDMWRYGPDTDHLTDAVGIGSVHHPERCQQDELGRGLGPNTDRSRHGLAGVRVPVRQQLEHHISDTLLRATNQIGILTT